MLVGHPAQHWPWLNALWLTVLFTTLGSWLSRNISCAVPHLGYVVSSFLAVAVVSFPFASAVWWVVAIAFAVLIALFLRLWHMRLQRMWGSQRSLWQNFMPPTVFLPGIRTLHWRNGRCPRLCTLRVSYRRSPAFRASRASFQGRSQVVSYLTPFVCLTQLCDGQNE